MLEHGVGCVRFRHVGTRCGVYEVYAHGNTVSGVWGLGM